MRRRKQQSLKKRLRNWFFKDSTSKSMSLKRKQENINKEDVRLYDKSERKICTEKGEYISIVKERERKCI